MLEEAEDEGQFAVEIVDLVAVARAGAHQRDASRKGKERLKKNRPLRPSPARTRTLPEVVAHEAPLLWPASRPAMVSAETVSGGGAHFVFFDSSTWQKR